MQHYAMLQRNLLYTGVTRGKRLVVLVGQKKAVAANWSVFALIGAINCRRCSSKYSALMCASQQRHLRAVGRRQIITTANRGDGLFAR
jgi:UvrD-like helicase C-terminal domain